MTNKSRLGADTHVLDLTGPAFMGIDLQTARLIVWGVHYQNISKVLVYLRARRLEIGKDDLYKYALIYRSIFRVDTDRTVEPRCWHCGEFLPTVEEELCECYNRAVPKVYIEPTLLAVEQEKLSFPNTWQTRLQSTYICSNDFCQRLNDVPLGVVASDLRKLWQRYEEQRQKYENAVAQGDTQAVEPREPAWRPKTKCYACYQQEQQHGGRRTSNAPTHRTNTSIRDTPTLASLIQTLPPTAES